ncbi:MAG: hypothetical protein ACI9O3_000561 [Colwellia sp.]|jgi:hypothetical protein
MKSEALGEDLNKLKINAYFYLLSLQVNAHI